MGYHGGSFSGGYNSLYSDFHVQWIEDLSGKIRRARVNPLHSTYPGINGACQYLVWNYFQRRGG